MEEPKRVVVVAAHPDDETLGCGGTIARAALEGDEITIITVTDGVSARAGATQKDIDARRADFSRAMTVLRIWDECVVPEDLLPGARTAPWLKEQERLVWHHLSLPDQRLDTHGMLDLIRSLEDILDDLKPHIVLTHSDADLNLDHQLVHRAVRTATRPIDDGRHMVDQIFAFEVPSSTEWGTTTFRPVCFVDISATLDKKILAMGCYELEARTPPHPRSAESLRALAVLRGSHAGLLAAEAFEVIRQVR